MSTPPNIHHFFLSVFLSGFAPLGLSCKPPQVEDPVHADLQSIPVTLETETGSWIIKSELADTPERRTQGLMFRHKLESNQGMLFLFPTEQPLTFWMRNTLISLDMIFIRPDHTIYGIIEHATPQTDTPRQVPGIGQYVLEVKGGLTHDLGIRAGHKASFYAPNPSN